MGSNDQKKTAGDVIYGLPQIVKVIWHEKLGTNRSEKITSPTAHYLDNLRLNLLLLTPWTKVHKIMEF